MAVKFLNGIDVVGSMNITANDIPDHSARKITSDTLDAARIPDLSGTYQPVGNYLTSIPSEYLTQTEGDARYLQSLPSHNHNTLYDAIGSAEAVQTFVNEQNFATDAAISTAVSNYLPLSGGTLSGNLTVGAVGKTSDTVVRSLADQSYKAGFEAYGNGQGTGYVYVGQSLDYGGGFSYNGDNSPGFIGGETADNITFFRRQAGTNTEVFHYAYSNNDVYFNGAVVASGSNSNNWNTAYGWGNHASAGYLTSLPSHNHDTLYDAIGSANAVNARIDEEVIPAINDLGNAIPTNNNQLTNGAGYATTSYVNTAVSNLVSSAPAALDTLNELAAALGDDANFSTTIANNIGAVNTRIDTEVLPAIDAKQNAGNYFTDGDTVLNMANNDGLVYDDTTNKMYVKLDGTNREIYHTGNTSFLRSDQADTMSGTLTITGSSGVSRLRIEGTTPTIDLDDADGDSFYIHVNSNNFYVLTDRDGGGDYGTWEGSHPMQLEADTNSAYFFGNKLNSAAYQASSAFDAAGSADAVQTWVGEQNFATDAAINTAIGTVTLASLGYTGATNANYITNNNQLTNGAGYITSYVNTTYTAGSGLKLSGTTFRLNGGEIPAGVDLNTYRTTGIYAQNSNSDTTSGSNWPTNFAGILEVWNDDYGNGIHCTQRYSRYNTVDVYQRNYYNGTWTSWRNLTQDTNTTYSTSDFDAAGSAAAVQTWVGEQNYASDDAINTAIATVTLSSLGYTGATNANYITNNNQLTNGAGYITSADGGNANLLDGLDLHTGRNNQANKVVRSNGSGYVDFGWINTTSGNTTSTLTDIYVNTNDGYIRKATPAHFRSQITDGVYDPVGSAAAVDSRIDTEVLPSIPTNNNQLTNGAGYITAVPSSFSTNSITVGGGVTLSESTDRADLLMIKSSTSTWGGLQVSNTSNEIIFSLMGDGTTGGIYDDQNSDWLIQWTENAGVRLYHNAGQKLTTTSTGVSITGALVASGDVTAFSDARVKENVETLPNALESVKQMRGVTYNKIGEEKQSVGVIAQELEEVVPQLVHTDEEGMKSVAYGNITAVLIEALKEQQAQIEELKSRLDGLTK
jgi:uncharacterized protein YidB (DUF937 family)